jgi:hypothetical protein
MAFHMKTTLNVDDTVVAQLKREAATGANDVRAGGDGAAQPVPIPEGGRGSLATDGFHSGGAFVDIADRDALYQAMEGR